MKAYFVMDRLDVYLNFLFPLQYHFQFDVIFFQLFQLQFHRLNLVKPVGHDPGTLKLIQFKTTVLYILYTVYTK